MPWAKGPSQEAGACFYILQVRFRACTLAPGQVQEQWVYNVQAFVYPNCVSAYLPENQNHERIL